MEDPPIEPPPGFLSVDRILTDHREANDGKKSEWGRGAGFTPAAALVTGFDQLRCKAVLVGLRRRLSAPPYMSRSQLRERFGFRAT